MSQKNKKYNILVVSNESFIINKLSMPFDSNKYNFELVRDTLTAISKIQSINYDLILINFNFSSALLDIFIKKIRLFDAFTYITLIYNDNNILDTFNMVKLYDIQSIYNKSSDFHELVLLVELITNAIYEFMRVNLQLDNYGDNYKSPYLSTVEILRNIVEYKDTYTIGHSFRVSKYSLLIGRYLKLSNDDLKILRLGSLFHDIGKISIPNSVLLKDSTLSSNEYLQIKAHPLIGSHILFPAKIYSEVIPIVKFHHERFDGNGYPSKLKGSDIPYLARIVAVADTFDAMTSGRTYRDPLPMDVVISEFKKNKGSQFDPYIVDTFLEILEKKPLDIKKIQNKYV